ncbi:hypothetical protein A45J_2164 [hot springs metagenome]|uniref:PD-(D/E)XK endonuclease-like domain-containing protein n=1 Tax=hot springs metagenome TaxID=433727 RepID=A0A5J4L401_9ZZZZ
MVKIFYISREHTNTAELLFKEALKTEHRINIDYSNILYLSPTPAKVKEASEIFHQLVDSRCYIPPEMATIVQYCKKLYSAYGNRRILNSSLIPIIISILCGRGIGFSSMIADFIRDIKCIYPDSSVDIIEQTFTDILHELNIPEAVTKTINEGIRSYRDYQLFITKNGLVDEIDIMNYVSNLQLSTKNSLLILDGFYEPSNIEKNVLKRLIQYSEKIFVGIPYSKQFGKLIDGYVGFLKDNFETEEIFYTDSPGSSSPNSLIYSAYQGMEDEVEEIARNIKSLYLSGKLRDLRKAIITFPVMSKYSSIIGRVFHRYGIPYDIYRGNILGRMRPFLDFLSLLVSVAEGYPRLKFSQFLSSIYFTRIPDNIRKWAATLSIESGIISGKEMWLNFVKDGSENFDISLVKEKDAIERDMMWIFEKLQPLEDSRKGVDINTYVHLIRNIIDDFGFLSSVLDSNVRDLRNLNIELLKQISFLSTLYPQPITLNEFIDIFSHLLNSIHIETEGTGVRIMDLSEIHGLSAEYIFLGGLTDKDMPLRMGPDYLLPDNVKRRLGFLHLDKYIEMQTFCFYNVIRSSKNLHLSYPLMEGEDMFLPSSFLYSGEEVKGKIPGIFSKEEYLIKQGYKSFSENISEIKTQSSAAIFKPSEFIKVTDIDSYRMCPRRFFIERVLKLKPMDVKEYELEANTIGTIIHRIMEKIIKEPFDSFDDFQKRAEAAIETSMRDMRIDAYWKTIINDTFMEILPEIYEKELEIREDGYVSTEVEKTIVGEPIKGMRLKGKIDRLDKIGDTVQIIDYKTGTLNLNCKQVLEGNENLQLFLYAAIAKNQGYRVSRVGIYSLKDISIKWCPSKRKARGSRLEIQSSGKKESELDDYIIAALRFLEEAVENMRKGNFEARPLNDYICWSCHEYAFCPYMQK